MKKLIIFSFFLFNILCSKNVFSEQIPDLNAISDCNDKIVKITTVRIDNFHNNYHTKEGRFSPFSKLLSCNGYLVKNTNSTIDHHLLKNTTVLVIANALSKANLTSRKLPATEAFTHDEIQSIKDWVLQGGSLLLIADHMPYPGAVKNLAAQFDFYLYNGFAVYLDNHVGTYQFNFNNNFNHPVIKGSSDQNKISKVFAFAGSAFRPSKKAINLLALPKNFKVRFPEEEWEFNESTPEINAHGLSQGAVRNFGKGKVAIFSEAAMFTAQKIIENDKEVGKVGFNIPEAKQNKQFILNLLEWLSN